MEVLNRADLRLVTFSTATNPGFARFDLILQTIKALIRTI